MRYTAVFLIALVAMTIQAEYNSPADKVLNKVDSLVSASRNEQAQQSKIYFAQAKRCVAEKLFREKEIADASVASGASAQQLQTCKSEKPIAHASLNQATVELESTHLQLNGLVTEHGVYKDANEFRQQEHINTLNEISGAYNIIGQFQNGKSALSAPVFVEVSQKLNKIVKFAIKQKLHHHLVPVMSALVQITASPQAALSTSALAKVVALLRTLEGHVNQSNKNRAAEWKTYEALYAKQTELLNIQVKALEGIIASYKKYISNLDACVAKETHIHNLAQEKLVRNERILSASIKMCAAYDAKYKMQTKERLDYIQLLGQLRAFIVSAISNFKSGLYSRGDFVHTM